MSTVAGDSRGTHRSETMPRGRGQGGAALADDHRMHELHRHVLRIGRGGASSERRAVGPPILKFVRPFPRTREQRRFGFHGRTMFRESGGLRSIKRSETNVRSSVLRVHFMINKTTFNAETHRAK